MEGVKYPPVFATNRPATGESVAERVNWLLSGAREEYASPPDVAIATAYLNPAGFGLLADELERTPKARLLIGAEPTPATAEPGVRILTPAELSEALSVHQRWLEAERDLTGFTREADGAARRLVEWLRATDADGNPRVEVRRYTDGFLHGKAFITDHARMPAVLAGSSNLTYAGLTLNAELNLGYPSGQHTHLAQEWFDEIWEASTPYALDEVYAARWDPHPPWTIFLRMLWELYGGTLEEEDDRRTHTELRLTGFQREGVARMLRLLDRNGGVIVADEVGLGKTFMAGEVISRATVQRRQQVLIVAPAALKRGMWDPFLRKYDFSRRVDVLSYDELRLKSRDDRVLRRELDAYALIVVDEAHNLRNPQAQRTRAVAALVGGANPKQLVLLTATPVNNTLLDLHSLVSLFVRNDGAFLDHGIPSIYGYIRRAQDMNPDELSHEHLFDLLDEVSVRRTRRFVKQHYAGDTIPGPDGHPVTITFPTPVLRNLDYALDEAGQQLMDAVIYALDQSDDAKRYDERLRDPDRLLLARYTPGAYHRDRDIEFAYQVSNAGLLRSTLLKRLESSVAALGETLRNLIRSHEAFLDALERGVVLTGEELREWASSDGDDLDAFLEALDRDVEAADAYHVEILRRDVSSDLDLLRALEGRVRAVRRDAKADVLVQRLRIIAREARSPSAHGLSSGNRRKVIVFSSFTATVRDAHRRLVETVEAAAGNTSDDDPLSDYRDRIAKPVYGSRPGISQEQRAATVGEFAPDTVGGGYDDRYDVLFATDVLSEGVNLQQAGRIINYDLPWNPMRVVQRHGRIDRIGSPHRRVFLDCFFPARNLDELLGLRDRVERKLRLADAAIGAGAVLPGIATGEGRVFSDDTRTQIERIRKGDESMLEGGHSALSGEEFRQRLRQALAEGHGDTVSDLPFGSGSGFRNPSAQRAGYVFCMRVRDQCRFRLVPVDERWRPLRAEDGSPLVTSDTLSALAAADPGSESAERVLGHDAYDAAFDAWPIARDDVHRAWMRLTDPVNLQPEVPKALRDAANLVHEEGSFLGAEERTDLLARLNTAPSERITREIRTVLRSDALPAEMVRGIRELVLDFGLPPARPPDPLPVIDKNEVHLVAWMAVGPAAGAPPL